MESRRLHPRIINLFFARLPRLLFVTAAAGLIGPAAGFAEEQAAEPAATIKDSGNGVAKLGAAQQRQEHAEERLLNRWESGLDARMTEILDDSSWILSAQWFRRYLTGTQLGLTLSAFPTPITRREDGVKSRTQMYYYGLALEQRILRYGYFRLAVAASYNYGELYQRVVPEVGDEILFKAQFTVIEPALYVFFYSHKGLDFGLSGSQRLFKFVDKDDAADGAEEKLSGLAYGLSFRKIF
jgi:hypothetical protein